MRWENMPRATSRVTTIKESEAVHGIKPRVAEQRVYNTVLSHVEAFVLLTLLLLQVVMVRP